MMKFALAVFTAVILPAAHAQRDGPIPRLNPNPTDTANPRLVGKAFPYDQLPYQIDTSPSTLDPPYRGPQAGYNICNDTTQGPESRCQTLIVNDLADFCLYAPQTLDVVGNAEPDVVAWCTQPTHGSRPIPPGTITGAQFIQAPSYIAFTGFFDQTKLNIRAGDAGGELDSGGQDARGNPMGGIAYSINMPSRKGTISQARMWHLFIGNNMFCMKFCDETAENASGLCRHTLDTYGCGINVPAAYRNNTFESCDGDDQQPVQVGVFDIPASSNCRTFASTELWPTTTSTSTTVGPTTTGRPSGPGGASGTTSGSGPGATAPPGDGAEFRSQLGPLAITVAVIMLTIGAYNA